MNSYDSIDSIKSELEGLRDVKFSLERTLNSDLTPEEKNDVLRQYNESSEQIKRLEAFIAPVPKNSGSLIGTTTDDVSPIEINEKIDRNFSGVIDSNFSGDNIVLPESSNNDVNNNVNLPFDHYEDVAIQKDYVNDSLYYNVDNSINSSVNNSYEETDNYGSLFSKIPSTSVSNEDNFSEAYSSVEEISGKIDRNFSGVIDSNFSGDNIVLPESSNNDVNNNVNLPFDHYEDATIQNDYATDALYYNVDNPINSSVNNSYEETVNYGSLFSKIPSTSVSNEDNFSEAYSSVEEISGKIDRNFSGVIDNNFSGDNIVLPESSNNDVNNNVNLPFDHYEDVAIQKDYVNDALYYNVDNSINSSTNNSDEETVNYGSLFSKIPSTSVSNEDNFSEAYSSVEEISGKIDRNFSGVIDSNFSGDNVVLPNSSQNNSMHNDNTLLGVPIQEAEPINQGDVINIGGNNYYVENGNITDGVRLRKITDSSIFDESSGLLYDSDRDKLFMDNSIPGKVDSNGFKSSSFSTVSDISTVPYSKVFVSQSSNDTSAPMIGKKDHLDDTSPGTCYNVVGDRGNGPEQFLLRYNDDGGYSLFSKSGEDCTNSLFHDFVVQSRTVGMNSNYNFENKDRFMEHSHVNTNMRYSDLESAIENSSGAIMVDKTRNDMIFSLANDGGASGQWTVEDATKYVDSLINSGKIEVIGENNSNNYFNSKYESWLSQLEGVDSVNIAYNLSHEVNNLRYDFESVKSNMVDWAGVSSITAYSAISCIINKLSITMDNIDYALIPATKAVEELLMYLKELKIKNDEFQLKILELDKVRAAEPPMWIFEEETYFDRKTNKYDNRTIELENPEHRIWVEKLKQLEEDIEMSRKYLDDLVLKVEKNYLIISNYQKNVKQFRTLVNPTGENYHMVSSADNVVDYHNNNDLTYELESYAKMPVITNITDYKVGDVVKFSDGYGVEYRIVSVNDDNKVGTVTIAAIDDDGEISPGASNIVVSDQREISLANYKRSDVAPPIVNETVSTNNFMYKEPSFDDFIKVYDENGNPINLSSKSM